MSLSLSLSLYVYIYICIYIHCHIDIVFHRVRVAGGQDDLVHGVAGHHLATHLGQTVIVTTANIG